MATNINGSGSAKWPDTAVTLGLAGAGTRQTSAATGRQAQQSEPVEPKLPTQPAGIGDQVRIAAADVAALADMPRDQLRFELVRLSECILATGPAGARCAARLQQYADRLARLQRLLDRQPKF